MKKKLQVFVSSTFTDLIEERQAAVSAILKSGHIPAGMELFTAGDQSQWEIIKRWIDESDVYMLILGGRYGSVEAKTGVSYTELEYNYALETNKPLFAVVINDAALEEKVKKCGRSVIETDHPAELKLFRQKVLGNMSAFFDDLKDIRLGVMESLPEIAASRDLSGWISGSEIPDTKGLVDEITKLNAEITSLTKENASLSKKLDSNPKISTSFEFEDLIKILNNTDIKIPPDLVSGKENVTRDLYNFFISYKEVMITGVTNEFGSDDTRKFLYFNVCPKLQIHDLVRNEKVAGVRWRRFSLSKKGQDFLAYVERQKLSSE